MTAQEAEPDIPPTPPKRPRSRSRWWLPLFAVMPFVAVPSYLLVLDALDQFPRGLVQAAPLNSLIDFTIWVDLLGFLPLVLLHAIILRSRMLMMIVFNFYLLAMTIATSIWIVGNQLLPEGSMLLELLLSIQLPTVIFIARRLRQRHGVPFMVTLGPYAALAVSLFLGGLMAIERWSDELPARIVSAAEDVAGEAPYCIENQGWPIKARSDLRGDKVLQGSPYLSYVTLATRTDPQRHYRWSFKQRRFMPLDSSWQERIEKRCPANAPHFAPSLE